MLVDLRSKKITGKEAERVLGLAHITVNKTLFRMIQKSHL
jgi:glycine hydroxymethyltransferase